MALTHTMDCRLPVDDTCTCGAELKAELDHTKKLLASAIDGLVQVRDLYYFHDDATNFCWSCEHQAPINEPFRHKVDDSCGKAQLKLEELGVNRPAVARDIEY